MSLVENFSTVDPASFSSSARPARGINPPVGFNTVVGFIAETWPHELELLSGDALAAYRDTEAKLREASATLGFPVHEAQCGGVAVPAFDMRVLRAFLPLL